YLKDGATEAEIVSITAALQGTPGVRRVRLVPSVEAPRQGVTAEQDKALAQLPASAFPTSLEVGFGDEVTDEDLSAMSLKLRAGPAVDTVETSQRGTAH